jgi:hypothetical protein
MGVFFGDDRRVEGVACGCRKSQVPALRVFISGEQTKENNENVGVAVNNLRLKLVSTGGKVVP